MGPFPDRDLSVPFFHLEGEISYSITLSSGMKSECNHLLALVFFFRERQAARFASFVSLQGRIGPRSVPRVRKKCHLLNRKNPLRQKH